MAETNKGDRSGDPAGRCPREDRAAEAPDGASGAAVPPTDPELLEDLGDELGFRGDQLDAALAAAQAEVAEWRDKAARAQADFENARKRLESRHEDALLRASERVITEVLPVVDDLERAIDHAIANSDEVAEGLAGIYRKLLGVLEKEGCSAIDPLGQPFDANTHNAVQMREDDEVPEQTVVEVFQKGYEMHGRVIRHAMVVVSHGGPSGGK
jgi:molecular chaperone GrpE